MRRTKIVCTIGPATASLAMLRKLRRAGMDVARLNFSHGTLDEHARIIERVRRIGGVTLLQDLAGPKVRIGPILGGSVQLKAGRKLRIVPRLVTGNDEAVGVNRPSLVRALRKGDEVLLAEGEVQLKVERVSARGADCRILLGGTLGSRKGITVPSRSLRIPALTRKDLQDIRFGVRHNVDLVALSFVQNAAEVKRCRRLAKRPVIAKIEKHEALPNLGPILAASDGIMVARGDLGVEIPVARLPLEQKRILAAANEAGKPTVTATQMLTSMVSSPRPTRAEVADIANAVLDGTDAVMLSEETAIGRYPVQAVRQMARVLEEVDPHVQSREKHSEMSPDESIAESACEIAAETGARAILVPTQSGTTARRVARCRPGCRILAFCPDPSATHRLGIVWGVEATRVRPFGPSPLRDVIRHARKVIKGRVVITAGWPLREHGNTNLVVVTTI